MTKRKANPLPSNPYGGKAASPWSRGPNCATPAARESFQNLPKPTPTPRKRK